MSENVILPYNLFNVPIHILVFFSQAAASRSLARGTNFDKIIAMLKEVGCYYFYLICKNKETRNDANLMSY